MTPSFPAPAPGAPHLAPVALAGPTASGKTAAALAIARHWPTEIISVDSALVYRGMDIGTAKPSADELAAAPHHLIDIRDPLNAYSAAEFVQDAQRLIREIQARGRLPLLVGGTMLYFKALFDGLDDMPPADPAIRAVIADQAAEKGWPALHAELAQVDPVTAARLAPNDSQRISRALEVFRVSGQPLSFFHQRKAIKGIAGEAGASDAVAGETNVPTAIPLISLEPLDRAWLHARIAQRFDAMLAVGFIDEVRALRQRGDLMPDLPAMRCVGYRQAWEALDAQEPSGTSPTTAADLARNFERFHADGAPSLSTAKAQSPAANTAVQVRPDKNIPSSATGKTTEARRPDGQLTPKALSELRDKGIFATRQLAKRQITWLRSMPQRQIVACDAPDALEQVLARVKAHIESSAKASP
ncbi:MAG: tRNA (adenosine(37)-N6)-dimethylallyltransferase MiaA [Pseudomonadota bacterium]|nr:tRNA (adenosine(37)-N6)-dimethylallyltransferase MiaA [Pseudomonadota bacterium]